MYEVWISSRLYTEPKYGDYTLTASKFEWVEVIRVINDEFVQVKYNNSIGYMVKDYFKSTEKWDKFCNVLSIDLKNYSEKLERKERWIITDNVNFRKRPSTDSDVLLSLKIGEKIYVQKIVGKWINALYQMTAYSLITKKDTLDIRSNYWEGWIFEPLTSTKYIPEISHDERNRRATQLQRKKQQKQLPTYSRKKDDKLQVLYDSGLLKKFNKEYNEAWVDPYIWYALDYDIKVGIGITLAKICDNAGSTGRIIFYNNKSGKKLARYSQAWGYKSYE